MVKILTLPKGRDPYDFYDTPKPFISAVYSIISNSSEHLKSDPKKVLDPGAGRGRWGHMARFKWPESQIDGVELSNYDGKEVGYDNWYRADFREWETDERYDLIVGNPPYSMSAGIYDGNLAEKFVRKSLELCNDDGLVFVLLKTLFVTSEGRGYGLFTDFPPMYIFQSVRRIPFRPELGNSTNTYDYAMFLWRKNHKPVDTKIRWFDWRGGVLNYVRNYS
jgi:hypothetical protein